MSESFAKTPRHFPALLLRSVFVLCAVALFLLPNRLLALETQFSSPGTSDDLSARLRAASATLSARANGLDTAQELFAASLSDYRTLIQVLYDAGYFSPVINIRLDGREAATIPLITPPSQINRIEISVQTGPAFRFGTARIAPLAPGTELPKGFARGQPAGTGILREATLAGRDGWRRVGHAKASVGGQKIIADHPKAILNADVTLIPGRKLTFGTLKVSGADRVRTEAIRRIAGIPTGQVYSPEMVQRIGARLRRTGAFSSVSIIESENANADGSLDFTASVTEQLPRRITFGGEVATNTGVALSAIWIHRNLFGAAERLRIEGVLRNIGGSEDLDGKFSIRLDNPARLGPDNNLFYLGEFEKFERQHYDIERVMFGVGVRRVISEDLYAEATLLASSSNTNDVFGDRRFKLVSLPLHAELDRRDARDSATRGYFLDARLTPFAGLSGAASGISAHIDGRAYLSLTDTGSVVLAGRLQLGSVLGASLSEISPEYLFFSGGAGTVRGQPFQSLGIPIGAGIAGGRSILAASAELRARVSNKISLVGFYDFGAVDSRGFVQGGSRQHSGAGIGVRYDLGAFGPIRLDLAMPVDGDTGDGLQFYIGIGQAF
ncbi:autotransporter assembly complex protein TamA [Arenibacterium sp. CAU 1754]